ncbi:hypothetical protein ABKN59_011489 [Abortiporus biennis]
MRSKPQLLDKGGETSLPLEIIILILRHALAYDTCYFPSLLAIGYLQERQAICLTGCLVSRTWNTVATPLLYFEPILTSIQPFIQTLRTRRQLRAYVRRLHYRCSILGHLDSNQYTLHLFRWPRIYRIRLLFRKFQKDIHNTIQFCTNTHTLCINHFHSRGNGYNTGITFLESPALSNLHTLKHLIIAFDTFFNTYLPKLSLPHLHALTIYECGIYVAPFHPRVDLPRLRVLQFVRTTFATPNFSMLESSSILSSVSTLEFHDCQSFSSYYVTGRESDSRLLAILSREWSLIGSSGNIRHLVLGQLHLLPSLFSTWRLPERLETITVFVSRSLNDTNTTPFKSCLEYCIAERGGKDEANHLRIIVNIASRASDVLESVTALREWCRARRITTEMKALDLQQFIVQRIERP